jgi:hypothetical protein
MPTPTVTTPINTDERAGITINLPIEAGVHILPGVIVAKNPAGNVIYATDAAGLEVIGRAEGDVDNTAGGAGALSVDVKRGVFKWVNSTRNSAAYALTPQNLGQICYVENEQTLCVAAGSQYLVKAGIFLGIDPNDGGAWVDTRTPFGGIVPMADTLTPLTFTTPTAAEVEAFRAAVVAILQAQGLIV